METSEKDENEGSNVDEEDGDSIPVKICSTAIIDRVRQQAERRISALATKHDGFNRIPAEKIISVILQHQSDWILFIKVCSSQLPSRGVITPGAIQAHLIHSRPMSCVIQGSFVQRPGVRYWYCDEKDGCAVALVRKPLSIGSLWLCLPFNESIHRCK